MAALSSVSQTAQHVRVDHVGPSAAYHLQARDRQGQFLAETVTSSL
jgi:hypothetical protein